MSSTPSFDAILTERLELVWMSPACMQALLEGRREAAETMMSAVLPGGWPGDARECGVLRRRLAQITEAPESAPWLLRAMVRRSDRQIVGRINFHGPPDEEHRAELGYTVDEAYRRQSYGSEAVLGLMGWAAGRGVRTFVLSISPENAPSLAMAAKLGFIQVGSQMDEEDGLEFVFERRVPFPGLL